MTSSFSAENVSASCADSQASDSGSEASAAGSECSAVVAATVSAWPVAEPTAEQRAADVSAAAVVVFACSFSPASSAAESVLVTPVFGSKTAGIETVVTAWLSQTQPLLPRWLPV